MAEEIDYRVRRTEANRSDYERLIRDIRDPLLREEPRSDEEELARIASPE
jgi:hypothetical protein